MYYRYFSYINLHKIIFCNKENVPISLTAWSSCIEFLYYGSKYHYRTMLTKLMVRLGMMKIRSAIRTQ